MPSRSNRVMDLVDVLSSEQLPWAVRFALELQRLGSRSELDPLFVMGCTLWMDHHERTPEAVAREEWAARP